MAFKQLLLISILSTVYTVSYAGVAGIFPCPNSTHRAFKPVCCKWYDVLDDLQTNLFHNECGQEVREAVRLTFHDAVGFSPTNGGGGADGSIITFSDTELAYAANADGGVEDIVNNLKPLVDKWKVSPGDLIYFAGAAGITNCPGAPHIPFFAGRKNPTGPAPDGTVNVPTDSPDVILKRFKEVGFSPREVVALLASHSIAAADGVPGPIHGHPFDSTARVFDSQFFVETQLNQTLSGLVRLPSDLALARDSRTACDWQRFVTDQNAMRLEFSLAMAKLSLIRQSPSLIDCSEAIPFDIQPNNVKPFFPGTLTVVDQACTKSPFPSLTVNPAVTTATPVNDF